MIYPLHQTHKYVIKKKKIIYDTKNDLIAPIIDIVCKNKINCKFMIHAFEIKKIFIVDIVNIFDKYII